MAEVIISENEWTNDCLEDRAQFNNYLIPFIAKKFKCYNDCDSVSIKLPCIVTKVQRYRIHKFSIPNKFTSISYGANDDRHMVVTLSKWYVMQVLLNYSFPKTDKQKLFESMMQFIEANLQTEFHEFLKKY